MGFADPWPGYSVVLRVILFAFVPAFAAWQVVRLRRALHVFQLEGYKRARFLDWCRRNRRAALFMSSASDKKPLVMTGRAWRLLVASATASVALVVGAPGAAHLAGGWPYDIAAWVVATALVFLATPRLLVASDRLLAPVQSAINDRYVRAARRRLLEVAPSVIGVTGSFGKTSAKFCIASLLGGEGQAFPTPGSFNTPLGVCRAINEGLRDDHRYIVVEMGAYGPGEIRQLCDLVSPKIGVLTAIGPAHLERFGSLDAIRRTKYELVASLPPDGLAVMNVDDPEVRALADATRHVAVARYGLDAAHRPDVTARDLQVTSEGVVMTIADERAGQDIRVRTRLLGAYAVGHVLAGVAVARAAGRPLAELAAPIASLRAVEHRLQIIEGTGGVTVIDDAYNSNPQGAAAALDVLASMPARRRVIVTPGIVELGEMQFEANRRFGERAAAVADALIVVAPLNREAIVSGARAAGGGDRVEVVDSLAAAQQRLRSLLRPGDVVLFENDLPDHLERADGV
jgi:UDP-N-acetylmuramoyl-tripeptide--D-alanyl-D-alanine ligase